MKSYLKDTKYLIQLLNYIKLDSGQVYLATADVASLYTIINHHEALQATRWALKEMSELNCPQRQFFDTITFGTITRTINKYRASQWGLSMRKQWQTCT